MKTRLVVVLLQLLTLIAAPAAMAQADESARTYRLYEGITAYVNNPDGKDFTVSFDLRDLNIYASGPREVLVKVYDPEGRPVVREVIPDDGVASLAYLPALGGWDHELDYYALCYSRGSEPMVRFSAWSDPARLATVVKRSFTHNIKGGQKGVYRVLLTGDRDHYITLKLDPALSYAVCGHHTWLYGHGAQWRKSFIYVPKNTVGLHLLFAEPDLPRTRRFTLTAPDGTKLFDGPAKGAFVLQQTELAKAGMYDDKILTLEVSEGEGDFMLHVILQQPKDGPFGEYVGMGSLAVFAPDEATAKAIQGGVIYEDGLVFWHTFQVRLHRWLKAHPTDDPQVKEIADGMRLIGPGDARGSATWTNLAYAMGYFGCKIWRPAWLFMKRNDAPAELKNIVREGLILGGDRLSFAVGIERCNGNAFAQIPVALWYCHKATGDELQKERFEVFFTRWRTEGWGKGSGISKSGDSQEHFAHDNHYGYYIMENWGGGTWVKPGILEDTDDPRFRQTFDRIRTLYSYIWCRDVLANPWSSRTHHSCEEKFWKRGDANLPWKGEPGPDFTVSVNDGNEWFAARRKNYYMLTFHGRLAPAWLVNTFYGQIGFGGGVLCQLTVPGKGTVLASTVADSYGKGMDLSNWRNFHMHSIVGEMWDGRPLVSGVSEHANAKLEGNVVTSSGEVRDRPVRVARRYAFGADGIDCEVRLEPTDYEQILSLWSPGRPLSEVRTAYEMIPFVKGQAGCTVTLLGADGNALGALSATPTDAKTIVIDRKGFGVRVELEKPMKVLAGANDTILVQLADKQVPAAGIALKYRLVPFGN